MTVNISITNNTVSLSFTDGVLGYIERGSFKVSTVRNDTGTFVDTFNFILQNPSANMDTFLNKFTILQRDAQSHYKTRFRDPPVWAVYQVDLDAGARYPKISNISMGDHMPVVMQDSPIESILIPIILLRPDEGFPEISPVGTPTVVVNAVTVFNHSVGSTINWVTIPSASIPGDMPADTIIKLENAQDTSAEKLVRIAKKTGATADLNLIETTLVFDHDTAGGFTNDFVTIPDTSLAAYRGLYHVFFTGHYDAGGDFEALHGQLHVRWGLSINTNLLQFPLTKQTVSAGINLQCRYVGTVSIPASASFEDLSSTGDYLFYGTLAAGTPIVEGYLGLLVLIPADEGNFGLSNITRGDFFMIDGYRKVVWTETSTGAVVGGNVAPFGTFLTLTPNTDNRLYFYWFGTFTESYPGDAFKEEDKFNTYLYNTVDSYNFDVTVSIYPRWRYLKY